MKRFNGSRIGAAATAGAAAAAIVLGSAAPAFAAGHWNYSGGYFYPKPACIAAMNDLKSQGYTILQGCTTYYSSQGGYLLDARIWVP